MIQWGISFLKYHNFMHECKTKQATSETDKAPFIWFLLSKVSANNLCLHFLATATTRGLPLPGFRTGIGADPKIVGWRRFAEKKSFGKKCFLMHSSSDHPCPCWRSYRSAMTSSSGAEMCDTDTDTDNCDVLGI